VPADEGGQSFCGGGEEEGKRPPLNAPVERSQHNLAHLKKRGPAEEREKKVAQFASIPEKEGRKILWAIPSKF